MNRRHTKCMDGANKKTVGTSLDGDARSALFDKYGFCSLVRAMASGSCKCGARLQMRSLVEPVTRTIKGEAAWVSPLESLLERLLGSLKYPVALHHWLRAFRVCNGSSRNDGVHRGLSAEGFVFFSVHCFLDRNRRNVSPSPVSTHWYALCISSHHTHGPNNTLGFSFSVVGLYSGRRQLILADPRLATMQHSFVCGDRVDHLRSFKLTNDARSLR